MSEELGATGRYPRGKLNADDQGELRIAIGREGSSIVVDFGKEVKWIGFAPEDARAFAVTLLRHVNRGVRVCRKCDGDGCYTTGEGAQTDVFRCDECGGAGVQP